MDVKFLDSSCNNGETNMRLDEAMLFEAISCGDDFATARFYTWSPKCVSLGKNQREVDLSQYDVDVVKRVTGGRALLHDMELTYSIVSPIKKGDSVLDSYKKVSNGLISGFKHLDVELEYSCSKSENAHYCMNISCGADISYKGKKLVGSAQFRSSGYFLQHGSILFDADFEFIEKIFKQKVDKDSIATLKEIDDSITIEALTEALKCGLYEEFR